VLGGHATFTIGAESVDAPTGALLVVAPGLERHATALEPGTTVLVVGAKPGSALPVSPYEHWYAAEPHHSAGDHEKAVEVASEGLADWPEHGMLHYQLACYTACAGHREQAIEHLRIAYEKDSRTRRWAADDEDLVSVRDDPRLVS